MPIIKTEGAPYPGFEDGALEAQDGTVTISDAATTGTVSFTPDAGFDTAPRVATSVELAAASGSAAASTVDRAEVVTRTTSSVEVEVELSAAPGAGETVDVRVDVFMFDGAN